MGGILTMGYLRSYIVLAGMLLICFFSSSAIAGGSGARSAPHKPQIPDGDTINLSGIILDNHKEPIGKAELIIRVNGKKIDHIETASKGKYVSRFQLEKGSIKSTTIHIEARKSSFKTQILEFKGNELAQKGRHFFLSEDITMSRILGPAFWISTIAFILAYVLIAFELLHRTIAAMLGAAFMLIIVGVLKHTGMFQWCAYISYKLAKGKVFVLVIYLMVFTAISSAFLDNVTTMLLLTGVAIEIAVSLSLNPLIILMPLVLASNVGGTATLIGDPPNIMIGSFAGLTFMDFVTALALVCGVSMVVLFIYTKLLWGKEYASAKVENVEEYIRELKEKYQITDPTLLTYGLAVLGFIVFLFLSHGYWHMEVSVAALTGASILLTVAILTEKVNMMEIVEKDIEWPTLMFFIFLFMLVGAVEESGLLALLADWILKLSAGNFVAACSLIIWVAAIMSAFVDNIPFTATMLPIVAYLSAVIPGSENTLWWALALGACFGGNGTIIGASANVVTMGIAEARGYRISFGGFMKVAFPFMIISVLLAHAWLLIFRPT